MKVLIVDDSPDDYFLAARAFRGIKDLQVVGRAADGEEAIAYLSGAQEFADRSRYPFPDLLLLDLRMPLMNGFEVLEWLRQKSFPDLKIAVLSGSNHPGDIRKALGLGAHFYYVKNADYAELRRSLEELQRDLVNWRPESQLQPA